MPRRLRRASARRPRTPLRGERARSSTGSWMTCVVRSHAGTAQSGGAQRRGGSRALRSPLPRRDAQCEEAAGVGRTGGPETTAGAGRGEGKGRRTADGVVFEVRRLRVRLSQAAGPSPGAFSLRWGAAGGSYASHRVGRAAGAACPRSPPPGDFSSPSPRAPPPPALEQAAHHRTAVAQERARGRARVLRGQGDRGGEARAQRCERNGRALAYTHRPHRLHSTPSLSSPCSVHCALTAESQASPCRSPSGRR